MDGLALAFANPRMRHPALQNPPRCLHCGRSTKKYPCSPFNKNGNCGRPYYACYSCGEFACFGDMRGVLAENPACFCDHGMQLSRRAIAGADGGETRIPRSKFYRCATGGCLYFDYMTDEHNRILIYSTLRNRCNRPHSSSDSSDLLPRGSRTRRE